jgi:hypothetical protein
MAALHTHCRRDLFHTCWKHLLDTDFLEAYRHGIVLQCPDGILRRVFPRIFTYSADYPEKCARFSLFRYSSTNQTFQGFDSDDKGHGLLSLSTLSHAKAII